MKRPRIINANSNWGMKKRPRRKMKARMSPSLFKDLLTQPRRALRRKDICKPEVCDRFFAYCDLQMLNDTKGATKRASIALRLATALKHPFRVSRGFSMLASAHRATGRYQHGEVACAIAFDYAKGDETSTAQVHRRCAYLRGAQGLNESAMHHINMSIDLYEALQDANELGKSLLYRGAIHYDGGRNNLSISDIRNALKKISPEKSPEYYLAGSKNLTIALSQGSIMDSVAALEIFPSVKKAMLGIGGLRILRIKLQWAEALISNRVGFGGRAQKLLESVLTDLIEEEMPQEIGAAFSHLVLISYPNRERIRILYRKVRDCEFLKKKDCAKIRNLIDKVFDSTRTANVFEEGDPHGDIRKAIRTLQKETGGATIPAFLEELVAGEALDTASE